jgi:hypothetical protein
MCSPFASPWCRRPPAIHNTVRPRSVEESKLKQNEFVIPEQFVEQQTEGGDSAASEKRTFVEPEISQPVDVLEATTFFQSVTSGVTN